MQPFPFTAAQRGDERHSPGVVAFGLDPSSVIPPYGTKGFGALPASDVKPTGGGRGARAIRADVVIPPEHGLVDLPVDRH